MTIDQTDPYQTPPGHIRLDCYLVDTVKLLPVYRRFRDLTDHDVIMTPFRVSVTVFNELVAAGWDKDEARRYMWAARFACEHHLDPQTGEELKGTAAIHPVRVTEAVKLVHDQIPGGILRRHDEIAANIVEALAEAGWRPTF